MSSTMMTLHMAAMIFALSAMFSRRLPVVIGSGIAAIVCATIVLVWAVSAW